MNNVDFSVVRNNDGKLVEFIKAKYQQRKYAKINQIDPMTVIIKMKNDKMNNVNSTGRNVSSLENNKNSEYTPSMSYGNNYKGGFAKVDRMKTYQPTLSNWVDKCDLIDDDVEEEEDIIEIQHIKKENKICTSLKKKSDKSLNDNGNMNSITSHNYHSNNHQHYAPHSTRNLPSKSYFGYYNNNNNYTMTLPMNNHTMKQSYIINNDKTIQSNQSPFFDFTKVNQGQSYQLKEDPFNQFLKG